MFSEDVSLSLSVSVYVLLIKKYWIYKFLHKYKNSVKSEFKGIYYSTYLF